MIKPLSELQASKYCAKVLNHHLLTPSGLRFIRFCLSSLLSFLSFLKKINYSPSYEIWGADCGLNMWVVLAELWGVSWAVVMLGGAGGDSLAAQWEGSFRGTLLGIELS